MTSEGLGEMFEGDSADICARKFPLVLWGAERRVSRAQTRERGPTSALAEIFQPIFMAIPNRVEVELGCDNRINCVSITRHKVHNNI